MEGPPVAIAVGEELVWVAVDGTATSPHRVIGIDPVSTERVVEVELTDATAVVAGEDVWVSQFWRDNLVRIDPTGAEDPRFLPVPELPAEAGLPAFDNCFAPGSLALSDRGVWFDGRGVLGLADPTTNTIVTVVVPPAGEFAKGGNVVVGLGYVWVDSGGSRVFRVDEDDSTWARAIEVGQHAGHAVATLAIARDRLWVGGADFKRTSRGSITNVLAESGAGVSTIDVPREAVTQTLPFDGHVTLASDGQDTVVVWESGAGLWVIEGREELERRPVLCSPLEAWVLATVEDTAWVGIYDAGEIWKIALTEAGPVGASC